MIRSIVSFSTQVVLISTCLAGIQRSSGFKLNLERIKIAGIRKIVEGFLELGEYCLDYSIGICKDSKLFVKSIKANE